MHEPIRLAIAPTDAATATSSSLAARLERRFGLGACPEKRRSLYLRLQGIVDLNPAAEILIREAASQATSARAPDRYFCSAVVKKLREANAFPDV